MKKSILFIIILFFSAGLLFSMQERFLPDMGVTYKSPYNSFLAAQLKLLPPVTTVFQPGTLYSLEKWDRFSPLGYTNILFNGMGLSLAITSIVLYNGNAHQQAQAPGYMGRAIVAYSFAYVLDIFEGGLLAFQNADSAVSKMKESDYAPFDGSFSYKDPCAAAGLSFISPALGSLYLGDWKSAIWWSAADVILVADVVSIISAGGGRTADDPMLIVDDIVFLGYAVSKILGVYMNSFATDELNVKFIIQELREQKKQKTDYVPVDPGFTVTMSLTLGNVLPGAGSLCAGNIDSFLSCLFYGIAGIGLYTTSFALDNPSDPQNDLPEFLRVSGSVLYSFARMSDLVNAPAYAQLKKSIYSGKPEQKQAMTEAFFMPYIYNNAAGLTFAMSY